MVRGPRARYLLRQVSVLHSSHFASLLLTTRLVTPERVFVLCSPIRIGRACSPYSNQISLLRVP